MSIFLALLTSVVWGVADFIGGATSKKLQVFVVVLVSQTFGLLTIVVYGFVTGWDWDIRALSWALIASFTGFVGLGAFYEALASGRMGIVSPIAALGALVPLGAGLLAGETPSAIQYLGVIVAIVGIVLASGPELNGEADPKPVFLAVVAALGFGTCMWAVARGAEFSVAGTMATMRLSTITLALIAVIITSRKTKVVFGSWGALFTTGVLDVSANVTYAYAATLGLLSLASVLGSLYPVVTVMLARAIFKEKLLRVQYIGITAAMIGVAAIAGG